jgi:sterol desaturase/sphingolipid hydroxylase (fatty acid hydroxylase superfamily)
MQFISFIKESIHIAIIGLSTLLITASVGFYASDQHKRNTFKSQLGPIVETVKEFALSSPVIALFQYNIINRKIGKIYYDIDAYGYFYLLLSPLIWLLTVDILTYWIHRAFHSPLLYKHIHYLHHSYKPVTAFTTSAVTLTETLIMGVIPFNLMFLIYPFHISLYYILSLYEVIWFTMSHIDLSFDTPGIFLSPHDHMMHHRYINKNFGVHTRLWDMLCRTRKI